MLCEGALWGRGEKAEKTGHFWAWTLTPGQGRGLRRAQLVGRWPKQPTPLSVPTCAPPLGTYGRSYQKSEFPKCSPGRATNFSPHPHFYSLPGCPPFHPKSHASFTEDMLGDMPKSRDKASRSGQLGFAYFLCVHIHLGYLPASLKLGKSSTTLWHHWPSQNQLKHNQLLNNLDNLCMCWEHYLPFPSNVIIYYRLWLTCHAIILGYEL